MGHRGRYVVFWTLLPMKEKSCGNAHLKIYPDSVLRTLKSEFVRNPSL